jgi:hypothetical protein
MRIEKGYGHKLSIRLFLKIPFYLFQEIDQSQTSYTLYLYPVK